MNIENIRNYCLSKAASSEDFPFDETTLVFRVCQKIFAMISLDNTEWFVVKCNPDRAIELRDKYSSITPAFHMNKKHWNQINIHANELEDEFIYSLIDHSYNEVVKKLPKKERETLQQCTSCLQTEEKALE
ncbi:MAG: MmcQ/YjbR family DNA-binding protein [Bacteroides sp.]|nr:MmcQ/YjbR family DNA-binding protein [Roseburia sp.]MCM1346846.1 MmcQ/YjbR family DNA-binding protein [Bacteroides sp.]MCM1419938.1 MmcQ/YjbR family DNA-binding protein [Bacteroides sp.]